MRAAVHAGAAGIRDRNAAVRPLRRAAAGADAVNEAARLGTVRGEVRVIGAGGAHLSAPHATGPAAATAGLRSAALACAGQMLGVLLAWRYVIRRRREVSAVAPKPDITWE